MEAADKPEINRAQDLEGVEHINSTQSNPVMTLVQQIRSKAEKIPSLDPSTRAQVTLAVSLVESLGSESRSEDKTRDEKAALDALQLLNDEVDQKVYEDTTTAKQNLGKAENLVVDQDRSADVGEVSDVKPTSPQANVDGMLDPAQVEREIETLIESVRQKTEFRLQKQPEKETMELVMSLLDKVHKFKDRQNILQFLQLINQAHAMCESLTNLSNYLYRVMIEHPELLLNPGIDAPKASNTAAMEETNIGPNPTSTETHPPVPNSVSKEIIPTADSELAMQEFIEKQKRNSAKVNSDSNNAQSRVNKRIKGKSPARNIKIGSSGIGRSRPS